MIDQSTAAEKNDPQESTPMPGGAPSEGEPITRQERNERWFEVATGIVLAIVAVAAAWSGYQSARWGGVQSERYTQASAKRVESTRASTLAGQHTLYDLNLFNQWLNAHAAETAQLAKTYEQRFRPEFRPAFEAWLATDPFNNPNAPPEPLYMPEYKVKEEEDAKKLETEAAQLSAQGKQIEANALLIQATQSDTVAGQQRLFDLTLFNQWLNAHAADKTQLTKVYEARFRPEFKPAFEAWLATDPFNNPNAPPGPLYMPQYAISEGEEAKGLEADAERLFAEGEDANQISDNYVLNGVFLAVCLFFLAIGERFKWMPVRIAVLIMATSMLIYGLYRIASYPIQ
jgi:hypothetical protein